MTDTPHIPGAEIAEPPEMALLRGPLSKRATSSEFNEWQAREVVAYIDRLREALAARIVPEGLGEFLDLVLAMEWDKARDKAIDIRKRLAASATANVPPQVNEAVTWQHRRSMKWEPARGWGRWVDGHIPANANTDEFDWEERALFTATRPSGDGIRAAIEECAQIVEVGINSLDGGVDAASRRYSKSIRALTVPQEAVKE